MAKKNDTPAVSMGDAIRVLADVSPKIVHLLQQLRQVIDIADDQDRTSDQFVRDLIRKLRSPVNECYAAVFGEEVLP